MKTRDLVIQISLIAGGGYILYQIFKKGFDPTSDQNIFYQGANKVVQAVTGQKDQTVGGVLYDFFHDNIYDPYVYSKGADGKMFVSQYQRRSDGQVFKASELSFLNQKTG